MEGVYCPQCDVRMHEVSKFEGLPVRMFWCKDDLCEMGVLYTVSSGETPKELRDNLGLLERVNHDLLLSIIQ